MNCPKCNADSNWIEEDGWTTYCLNCGAEWEAEAEAKPTKTISIKAKPAPKVEPSSKSLDEMMAEWANLSEAEKAERIKKMGSYKGASGIWVS